MRRGVIALAVLAIAALADAGGAHARGLLGLPLLPTPMPSAQYGYVTFPEDEHQHPDGWNYWWGSADLVTESGNRYTVGFAFDSFYGVGATGHELYPQQGPYKGKSILTVDGPTEWGHPNEQTLTTHSFYVPGISDRLKIRTLSPQDGLREIGRLERTSTTAEQYDLRIDNPRAKVFPSGERVRMGVDLELAMRPKPLLLGGTGRWWYGLPEAFRYPSRSYQYMQTAQQMTGTLELQQPDGSILRERIVPAASTLVLVREYDATPEDLFAGLALAESTQLHVRYPTYYHAGMPWDLVFVDLRNGAQLMVAVLAFHDTRRGITTPLIGRRLASYQVLATLRIADGRSIPLDNMLHVEQMDYRTIIGRVPTFAVSVQGFWKQAWGYRVSYKGGEVTAPDGARVRVPSLDIGLLPQYAKTEHMPDAQGNGLTQRVPFVAAGSYGGCPVRGFGWSELIINWYGKEQYNPWFTAAPAPPVPAACGSDVVTRPDDAPLGPFEPDFGSPAPLNTETEGCTVMNPSLPTCAYVAASPGGIGGLGSEPGGWEVRVERPGVAEPFVVKSLGGYEIYACDAIKPGDRVTATAVKPLSGVVAGNPGFCF